MFDANVWKYILLSPQNPNTYEQPYIDFFDAIINLSANDKCKKKPFIYLNGLILSEVYNACIKAHWEAYTLDVAKIKLKEYRVTQDHNSNRQAIQTDLKAYIPYLIIETDLLHKPDNILFEMPGFSDFNDHYYFRIAQSKALTVVTNDSDFKYSGIEILTMQRSLLKLP